MLATIALSRWGKFKPIHFACFGSTTLGMGLLSLLDEDTSIPKWAVFQIIGALGIGIIINTLLPASYEPTKREFSPTWGSILPEASTQGGLRGCSSACHYSLPIQSKTICIVPL
ncbi:hypothetical protein B0T25DRAFT_536159 [Lasiosphaeria hispida]|uniref:Major facilitator superfamily (MFS) profile domain-containing protein n=1 Tax=Lasiosphaeria hispida TaxID=260671 RepID=A0AAJ0HT24_9PEZI|nr:hypothetical protein B0T25DRAFT_536159 [Lasiosphaeria hispida]